MIAAKEDAAFGVALERAVADIGLSAEDERATAVMRRRRPFINPVHVNARIVRSCPPVSAVIRIGHRVDIVVATLPLTI